VTRTLAHAVVAYPSTVPTLIAIFMTEKLSDDGERVGYIDLFDPGKRDTVAAPDFDDTAFMTESEARALAAQRGWRFQVQ
jgi:hypothetical protein